MLSHYPFSLAFSGKGLWVGLFEFCLQRSSGSRVESFSIMIQAIRLQSGYPEESQFCVECPARIEYFRSVAERVLQ